MTVKKREKVHLTVGSAYKERPSSGTSVEERIRMVRERFEQDLQFEYLVREKKSSDLSLGLTEQQWDDLVQYERKIVDWHITIASYIRSWGDQLMAAGLLDDEKLPSFLHELIEPVRDSVNQAYEEAELERQLHRVHDHLNGTQSDWVADQTHDLVARAENEALGITYEREPKLM